MNPHRLNKAVLGTLTGVGVFGGLLAGGVGWGGGGWRILQGPPAYTFWLALLVGGLIALSAALLVSPRPRAQSVPRLPLLPAVAVTGLAYLLFLVAVLAVIWNATGYVSSSLYGRIAGRALWVQQIESAPQGDRPGGGAGAYTEIRKQLEWAEKEQDRPIFGADILRPLCPAGWTDQARRARSEEREELNQLFARKEAELGRVNAPLQSGDLGGFVAATETDSSLDVRQIYRRANDYVGEVDGSARRLALLVSTASLLLTFGLSWLNARWLWRVPVGPARSGKEAFSESV